MASAYDRLPLGALRMFEAVATHLSFTVAAEALNVTPAAVSQQIKTLEAYVQVPLFRRAGPMQVSLIVSFLQMWLLPRLRSFRRKYPDIDLRFHTSRELVDFSRTENHIAIRFGHGHYPNLHVEKLLDEWLVPVASPELIKQYGTIERGADLGHYPLLNSDSEPWSLWSRPSEEAAWRSGAPNIDDSAGILAAAEASLGFALARWTLVSLPLQRGTLRLAGKDVLPYESAYYFVCPKPFLDLPKVAHFREWIFASARDFPRPAERLKTA